MEIFEIILYIVWSLMIPAAFTYGYFLARQFHKKSIKKMLGLDKQDKEEVISNSMTSLKLSIDCDKHTCASKPGVFCEFIRTHRYGTVHYCAIWHDLDQKGRPCPLNEIDGWLQRRTECMEKEIKVT